MLVNFNEIIEKKKFKEKTKTSYYFNKRNDK